VQFNVSQLLREPVGSRRRYVVADPFDPLGDGSPTVTLAGSVELMRTDRGVLATATLQSTAAGECARCLLPVTFPVELVVEEEYLPTVDPVTGASLPVPNEPGGLTIDGHHILDLTQAAQQAWLLAEPMQVLCRENCAGLCPECGADRNTGLCRCAGAPLDSRWAALAPLRLVLSRDHEEN